MPRDLMSSEVRVTPNPKHLILNLLLAAEVETMSAGEAVDA